MNIFPSILTDSETEAQNQLTICSDSGLVQGVQLDIIDGYFVDNMTIFPGSYESMNFEDLEVDFHLMTQEPLDFVREIADFKDLIPVRAVIGQIEQMSSQELFVDEVRRNNWDIGFSLNLHTPLESVEDDLWERINIIQLMSVQAGVQGQKFHEYTYTKLEQLHDLIREKDLKIEIMVDGGVNLDNFNKLLEYGVETVTPGSYLWKADDFAEAFQNLEVEVY
jgi:ribulose-phosphate 3-epimerase